MNFPSKRRLQCSACLAVLRALTLIVFACAVNVARADGSAESIPAAGNAWLVATADVTGDPVPEIVYACYDGTIACQSSSNNDVLWKYQTGAFPYDLTASDLDGNGKSEVLVASADGRLSCIGKDGTLRWSFAAPAPLFQVAAIHLDGGVRVLTGGVDRRIYVLGVDGRLIKDLPWYKSIRLIRTGDLDGDGRPEIVVVCWTGETYALRGDTLEKMWWTELREGASKGRGGAVWFPMSLAIEDLDGDGPCELIFGSGYLNRSGIRVLNGDGSLRWEKSDGFEPDDAWGQGHTAVAVCNLGAPLGRQIVALNGRYLFLVDRTGRMWASGSAQVPFTSIGRDVGSTVYLSSSPNGDDRIYRVRLDKGWQRPFASLNREGKMRQVTENLARVRAQIMAYSGSPPTNKRYVQVVSGGTISSERDMDSFFALIAQYRQAFPYPNIVFANSVTIRPDEPVAGFPQTRTPTGISSKRAIDLLKRCEKAGVPFVLSVAHGCRPWVPLDMVEKIAVECPKTCVGFMATEDEDLGDRLARFMSGYWLPLMDICKKTGKKAILAEQSAWWATVPAMSRFRRLVDGTYADVLVMGVEDSNTRCPELNLSGRLGLFLAGAANGISARTIADETIWNRQWLWECLMTGHPFLRRQMVQALLGAKHFEYRLPLRQDRVSGGHGFSLVGAESVELVTHMLGKGLLVSPAPKEMAALSPCAIQMREPAPECLREVLNQHGHDSFSPDPVELDSPLEGLACHRGMAPVRPAYLGGYLMGVDRHFGGFIPPAPFGFPVIVPAFIDRKQCFWANRGWETDGRSWFEGSRRRSGLDARSSVLQSFEQAADDLPVRLEGKAFMQVQSIGAAILRVTLIDPGFLDPADRPVKLRWRPNLKVKKVVDLLSGQPLTDKDRTAELTVPAGTFRIIELHGEF